MIQRWWHHIEQWQFELRIQPVSELFIRAMYAVLLWSTIKLSTMGAVIWGSDNIHQLYDPYTNIDRFAMLLNNEAIRPYWWVFAGLFAVLLLLGLFGWHNVFTRAAVAYLFVVLHFGNVEISTGGHHLTQQLLFFHILLFKVDDRAESYWASIRRFLHHVSFYAIWLQIGIMYLVAGYWKLTGTTWMDGTAMLLTLSYKEFGFPWLAASMQENNALLWISNHIVFAYQLLFIVLIWIKSIRPYFLSIGLIFHLSIAFIVGITDFGLLMVASYAIFIAPETARKG
jgi:hypothetical protein